MVCMDTATLRTLHAQTFPRRFVHEVIPPYTSVREFERDFTTHLNEIARVFASTIDARLRVLSEHSDTHAHVRANIRSHLTSPRNPTGNGNVAGTMPVDPNPDASQVLTETQQQELGTTAAEKDGESPRLRNGDDGNGGTPAPHLPSPSYLPVLDPHTHTNAYMHEYIDATHFGRTEALRAVDDALITGLRDKFEVLKRRCLDRWVGEDKQTDRSTAAWVYRAQDKCGFAYIRIAKRLREVAYGKYSGPFDGIMTGIICLAGLLVGLGTYWPRSSLIATLDTLILASFILEYVAPCSQ